jgi:hypothetical protein
MSKHTDRPDVPKAHHFEAAFCEDPNCGLHIIAMSREGKPMCEIVMGPQSTVALIDVCKIHLYEKATKRI